MPQPDLSPRSFFLIFSGVQNESLHSPLKVMEAFFKAALCRWPHLRDAVIAELSEPSARYEISDGKSLYEAYERALAACRNMPLPEEQIFAFRFNPERLTTSFEFSNKDSAVGTRITMQALQGDPSNYFSVVLILEITASDAEAISNLFQHANYLRHLSFNDNAVWDIYRPSEKKKILRGNLVAQVNIGFQTAQNS